MRKRFLKLEATAANILQACSEKANLGFRVHCRPGFFRFLSAHQYFACQNQSLRPLSRTGESAFQQELVESDFHNVSVEFTVRAFNLPPKCQQLTQCKV
jgi:hypothetical protein